MPSCHNQRAVTLVEVLATVAILGVMLAGLATLDRACRSLAAAQRETALASQVMEELVEQLRASNWTGLTKPAAVSGLLRDFECESLSDLSAPVLRLSVAPYPPVTPAPKPLLIERSPNGQISILSEPPKGFSLRSLLAVRIDARLAWRTARGDRIRSREIASVVALSGLLK